MLFFPAPEVTWRGTSCWVSWWQPLNARLRNKAVDGLGLSLHWSWQCPESHGAKWCLEFVPPASFCLIPGYQLPWFPWDGFNHKTRSSRPLWMLVQFSWHGYKVPDLAQWKWTWNCWYFQELWKNQTQPGVYWSSRREILERSFCWARFPSCPQWPIQSLKPTWHVTLFC